MHKQDIIKILRDRLISLRDHELAKIDATKPKIIIHNEPVDYKKIAILLDEVIRRFVSAYAPLEHRHQWQEIDGAPTAYPPSVHTHQEVTDNLRTLSIALEALRSYASDIDKRVNEVAALPVSWHAIEGKPLTYPPEQHRHERDSALVALLRLFDQGAPGEVLTRVRDHVAWKPIPINAFYYPSEGGGGGGSGWLPNKSSGLPGTVLPLSHHYITMELEFDVEIEFQGEMLYVE